MRCWTGEADDERRCTACYPWSGTFEGMCYEGLEYFAFDLTKYRLSFRGAFIIEIDRGH